MSDAIRADRGSQAADPDMVAEAVAALSCFGADLTLADAMKLLPMWRGFRLLTPAEVDATLRHFAGGAR